MAFFLPCFSTKPHEPEIKVPATEPQLREEVAKTPTALRSSAHRAAVPPATVATAATADADAADRPLETQAYVFPARGAKLELRTVTLPPLGETEVQVEISHCGLCHTDIHMGDNDWGVSDYPLVPGHEGYGVVTHVGKKVQGLKVGNHVGIGWVRDSCGTCSRCRCGRENLCEAGYQGTFLGASAGIFGKKAYNAFGGCFAKVVRIQERFAFHLPGNLPPEVACPLMCAGGTVFEPICTWVTPGSHVGIGSLGGLGTLGVQLAKKLGARVTVFSRSTAKRQAALAIGADGFVDTTDTAAMKAAEGTLDVFIDTCPVNQGVDHLLALCKIDGAVVRVGLPPASQQGLQTNWLPLVFTAKKVAGSIVCGSQRTNEMVKLVSENKDFFVGASPWAASTIIPFSQVNEAMDKLRQQSMDAYRIVLKW